MSRGAKRTRRREAQRPLPPLPHYVRYPRDGGRYWRLGGPLTRDHEAEARRAQQAKPPGRLGRLVLRLLGGGGPAPGRPEASRTPGRRPR